MNLKMKNHKFVICESMKIKLRDDNKLLIEVYNSDSGGACCILSSASTVEMMAKRLLKIAEQMRGSI